MIDLHIMSAASFDPEDIFDLEFIEWNRLTPQERFAESAVLFLHYLAMGGSLDPEPDSQSPFYFPDMWGKEFTHGGAGLHFIRRSGV